MVLLLQDGAGVRQDGAVGNVLLKLLLLLSRAGGLTLWK
jgi:hypothetical protein